MKWICNVCGYEYDEERATPIMELSLARKWTMILFVRCAASAKMIFRKWNKKFSSAVAKY